MKVFEATTSVMKKHNLSLNNKKEVFESEKGKEYFNGKLFFIDFYVDLFTSTLIDLINTNE